MNHNHIVPITKETTMTTKSFQQYLTIPTIYVQEMSDRGMVETNGEQDDLRLVLELSGGTQIILNSADVIVIGPDEIHIGRYK